MTAATTKIERSGPVIRATLAACAPDECAQFEAEFQQAIEHVSEKFDLAPIDAVLDRVVGYRCDPSQPPVRAGACAGDAGPGRGVRRVVGAR